MPGRILIVDDEVTRRITLAARLSGAFYDIRIAGSDTEALSLMAEWKPGAILVADQLAAPPLSKFLKRIRKDPRYVDVTIFVVTSGAGAVDRTKLLGDGADDVIPRGEPDEVFHARLRSYERARVMIEALQLPANNDDLPGLSEPATPFPGKVPVTFVAPDRETAQHWESTFGERSGFRARVLLLQDLRNTDLMTLASGLLVLGLLPGDERQVFRIIAELQSQRNQPETEILLLAPEAAPDLVVQSYDIGASAVMTTRFCAEEVTARLNQLQTRLLRRRGLRETLTEGLRASITDPLTGLHNRRFALPRLAELSNSSSRRQSHFAVCIVDLDHFKAVNDAHGHLVGDYALQAVAMILRDSLRSRDMVARIGGEEFLVVLPDTDPDAAAQIANRLCAVVRQTPVGLPRGLAPISLSISVGVTTGQHGLRTPDELIADADSALYSAKRGGRDQVAVHARPDFVSPPRDRALGA